MNLHVTNKFVPKHPNPPPPPDYWNELLFPREFPLAFFEMSYLLPHFLKEGRGKLDVYFTRVYNPLWTNPDGFSWMEVLQDQDKIGLHVALSPTWSETAWFADYILPMGLGTERHDTMSQETHAGQWLGFRQPVLRVAREKRGETFDRDPRSQSRRSVGGSGVLGRAQLEDRSRRRARHPQVLREPVPSRRADHDGRVLRLDVRELGAGPARGGGEGEPDAAAVHAQVRRLQGLGQELQPRPRAAAHRRRADRQRRHEDGTVVRDGAPSASWSTASRCAGFNTPSRRLEFYSPTLAEWGWPEHAVPRYVPGHVHWRDLKREEGEFDLLPNFRLPTLVHTRSAVKWLYEISHANPLWISTADARQHGIQTGDLVKLRTRIGYFVTRAWVTEGIRPGVLGMSHHLGRWRLKEETGGARNCERRWCRSIAKRAGRYRMRQEHGAPSVREQRSRQPAHLVERDRRAPEPDVPGAARPGQRHALLAPARPAGAGRPRRSLRRHRGRYGQGARGV